MSAEGLRFANKSSGTDPNKRSFLIPNSPLSRNLIFSVSDSKSNLTFFLDLEQGCKRDHPRPDFLSLSPFFAHLLLKPTQKGDGKPMQKSSVSQP